MTPRATPRAISGWTALRASAASAFLPDAIADSTCLMKVRMRLTREWLIVWRLAFRRMRFLACGVFAIVFLVLNEKRRGPLGSHRSAAAPTRNSPQGQRRSVLALGAIEGRATTLDDPAHGPAAAARFSFAVVYGECLRKVAELPIRAG